MGETAFGSLVVWNLVNRVSTVGVNVIIYNILTNNILINYFFKYSRLNCLRFLSLTIFLILQLM